MLTPIQSRIPTSTDVLFGFFLKQNILRNSNLFHYKTNKVFLLNRNRLPCTTTALACSSSIHLRWFTFTRQVGVIYICKLITSTV